MKDPRVAEIHRLEELHRVRIKRVSVTKRFLEREIIAMLEVERDLAFLRKSQRLFVGPNDTFSSVFGEDLKASGGGGLPGTFRDFVRGFDG